MSFCSEDYHGRADETYTTSYHNRYLETDQTYLVSDARKKPTLVAIIGEIPRYRPLFNFTIHKLRSRCSTWDFRYNLLRSILNTVWRDLVVSWTTPIAHTRAHAIRAQNNRSPAPAGVHTIWRGVMELAGVTGNGRSVSSNRGILQDLL